MAINAATNWYVRAGGAELNGGGYDSTISGAGTNYADQDAAQLSLTDFATSGAGSTTLTSATGGFTSAMIGNCIRISAGTNFQTGYYFVTGHTDTNTVTLDRTPTSGGAGSGGTGRLGGAHPDLRNYASGGTLTQPAITTPLAAGHTVNIRGASGNPDYDWSGGYWIFPAGSATVGRIAFKGYNVRPLILFTGLLDYNADYHYWENFQAKFAASPSYTTWGWMYSSYSEVVNAVFDMNGVDGCAFGGTSVSSIACNLRDIEIKNSGGTTAGTVAVLGGTATGNYACSARGIYIHDVRGPGIQIETNQGWSIRDCIVANSKSTTASVILDGTAATYPTTSLVGVTVDNGQGDGLRITDQRALSNTTIRNIIVSNHAQSGKYGINVTVGDATANDRFVRGRIDHINIYNCTAARNNLNAGPNDLALDPQYANAGSGDYSVGVNMKAEGWPTGYGPSSTTLTYVDLGAAQRQEPAASGGRGMAPQLISAIEVPSYI